MRLLGRDFGVKYSRARANRLIFCLGTMHEYILDGQSVRSFGRLMPAPQFAIAVSRRCSSAAHER